MKSHSHNRLKEPDHSVILWQYAKRFLYALEVWGYSPSTIANRRTGLKHFCSWCEERGFDGLDNLTKDVLRRYQNSLHHSRHASGRPLSAITRQARLMAVRVYCKWLYQEGYVSYHVGEDMRLPKVKKKLPGHLLSFQEVELVLSEPDTTTALGVRDRAMLEVLYSAGLRRKELVGILVEDVDFMRGQLFVRNAKGGVERYVPLGRRAIMWLDKYLVDVRPVLVVNPSERALFLGFRGSVLSIHQLGQIVKGYLLKAGIEGPGSCHLFRHSCATQMLDNGADIRYIQQFLGHRDITSTQVYTQVSLAKLKEVHAKCHPAEKGREKE